jgi:uncharacterized protein (TIGR02996 family)
MQAFIEAILEQPADETTWLVFSDWLEDREIPNRIREYRNLNQKAKAFEAQPDWWYKELSTKKYLSVPENVSHQWAILCAKFLPFFWHHLDNDARKTITQAELKWCGLPVVVVAPQENIDKFHKALAHFDKLDSRLFAKIAVHRMIKASAKEKAVLAGWATDFAAYLSQVWRYP